MTNTLEQNDIEELKKSKIPVIDCDLHASPKTFDDLLSYMPEYWRNFLTESGWQGVFQGAPPMAILQRNLLDSQTPDGGLAASSLSDFREQVADKYNYSYAVINPDASFVISSSPQLELAATVASAFNDWQIEHWLSKDSSMLGSVVVAAQNPEQAAREIDRVGSHPQIVQVALPTYCPYGAWGNPRYYPIWEAAVNNLIICFHVSTRGGLSRDGFEVNYFVENQVSNCYAPQAGMTSLVFGGVLERYKELRLLFNEGGFGWAPNIMYAMDTHWPMLKREVPWVKRAPSEQVREHFWFGTQPLMEPNRTEDAKHVVDLADMIGRNKLVYTSDYPHFTYNPPEITFKHFPREFRERILYKNAAELYGLTI